MHFFCARGGVEFTTISGRLACRLREGLYYINEKIYEDYHNTPKDNAERCAVTVMLSERERYMVSGCQMAMEARTLRLLKEHHTHDWLQTVNRVALGMECVLH